jgi:hypothetical protein
MRSARDDEPGHRPSRQRRRDVRQVPKAQMRVVKSMVQAVIGRDEKGR